MKKLLNVTYLFLMVVVVILFSYVTVETQNKEKLLTNKESVSIVLNQSANTDEFIEVLIDYASTNDLTILRTLYSSNLIIVYSTRDLDINDSILKSGNKSKVFDIRDVNNAGYDGDYYLSSNSIGFCEKIIENNFGTCEVNARGETSNLVLILSVILITPLLLTTYIIFNFIVLMNNKKYILQHIDGMSTRKIIRKFYSELLKPIFIILFIIVLLIIFYINEYAALNVIIFLLFVNIILFIFSYLLLYYNIRKLYKINLNSVIKNRSEKSILNYTVIKIVLVVTTAIALNIVLLVGQNTYEKYSKLDTYEKLDKYYGFGIKYVGQESMSYEESAIHDKNNTDFYKSLDHSTTYVLTTNDYDKSVIDTPVGKIYNNYVFANEMYLRNIMNINTVPVEATELTVYVPTNLMGEIDDIKGSVIYSTTDLLTNNDIRYNFIEYQGGTILALNPTLIEEPINNPIIIQDNLVFENSFYSSIMTHKAVYTNIIDEKPYEAILPDLQKHNLEKQIVEVYTPHNQVIKTLQTLKNTMLISLIILTILVITIILTILNITRIMFIKRGKEYTLKYISGISPKTIFKKFFIEDIVFLIIYVVVAIFIPVPYILSLIVLLILLAVDISVKLYGINTNLKSNINSLIKGEI